jgi:large subunit ribosomal protein L27
MAHTKAQKAAKVNKDSISKRRGIKVYGGSVVIAGNIIVRQKGSNYLAGDNVYMGKDFTLHAQVPGTVLFKKRLGKQIVSVTT